MTYASRGAAKPRQDAPATTGGVTGGVAPICGKKKRLQNVGPEGALEIKKEAYTIGI